MSRRDGPSPNAAPTADASVLRDAVLWLLERRDWGAKAWRMERLRERLARFPPPTGLLRELEQTIPAQAPRAEPRGVGLAAGNKLAASEFATKTVELLQALSSVMSDAAMFDSELQNSIRTFGESIPKRAIVADLRRLVADTRAVDLAARRARRREYQRRQEVSKIVGTLARAVAQSSERSDQLSQGLDTLVQQVWAHPDVDGLRSLRVQITDRLQALTEESRSLRDHLEGARSRTSALEHLVAEQAEKIVDLRTAAYQDPLTGLANRRAFDELLPQLVETCRSTDTPFALAIVDIDHFKLLNDTHGHPFGDTVLQGVAEAIARAVRQDDVVARFGGEEFAVFIRGAVPNVARAVADRLRRASATLRIRPEPDDSPVVVTSSAGLANLRPGDDAESLYARADAALYRAKQGGRDRLVDDWLDDEHGAH